MPATGVLTEPQRRALDRAYHDTIASEYDRVIVAPRAPANDLLFAPLLAGLRGERMVDLGCGTGHMLLRAARHFTRVEAVDHSEGMLAVARWHCRRAGLQQVHFERADVDAWVDAQPAAVSTPTSTGASASAAAGDARPDGPAAAAPRGADPAGGGVDLFTCVGFLHHLGEQHTATLLARLAQLLSAQGTIVIAEPIEGCGEPPADVRAWNAASPLAAQAYASAAEEPDEAPLHEPALRAAIAAAGLEVVAESRCWEVLAHAVDPGWLQRLRLRRLFRAHSGTGNVLALRLQRAGNQPAPLHTER